MAKERFRLHSTASVAGHIAKSSPKVTCLWSRVYMGHSETSEVSSPGEVSGFWDIVAKLLVQDLLAQHHDRVPPHFPLATDHWIIS